MNRATDPAHAPPDPRPADQPGERGHSALDHTADAVLTAWAPTREACLEEAAMGLVSLFADVEHAGWSQHVEVELDGEGQDLLIDLLEEVIYRLDTDSHVPVRVHVVGRPAGVVAHLWLTDRTRACEVGATPKGVAHSDLRFGPTDRGGWRCQVTIDV